MANGIQFSLAQPFAEKPTPVITPAVDDFLAAFRSGFITTDDIKRRAIANASSQDQLKTQLAEGDLRRKEIVGENEILPGKIELTKRQQGITGQEMGVKEALLPAQRIAAEKEARDVAELADPVKRPDAINRKRQEAIELQYAQTVGELPPAFELDKPGKALDLDKWTEQQQMKLMQAADDETRRLFPQAPDSPEANQFRARQFQVLQGDFNANVAKEYADYVRQTATSKAKVERGTPEYNKELSRRLTERIQKDALQQVQVKAYGAGLEAQAKAAAERPAKLPEVGAKLRAEVEASKPIQNFRLQNQAAELVRTMATIPNPTNRTDLQLIYAAVKLADPGSVVREGEIALSRQADPVLVSMKKRLEGITSRSGKLLDNTDRAELLRIAETVISQSQKSVQPEFQKFQRLAEQQGVPLADVLNPAEQEIISGSTNRATAASPSPAPHGQRVVQDGVTFQWNGTEYVPVQ